MTQSPPGDPNEMVWHHVYCTVCGEDRSTNVATGEQVATLYRAPRSYADGSEEWACGACGGPMAVRFLSERDAAAPWRCEGGPYHEREILFVERGATHVRLPIRPGIGRDVRPVTHTRYAADWINRVLRWDPE